MKQWSNTSKCKHLETHEGKNGKVCNACGLILKPRKAKTEKETTDYALCPDCDYVRGVDCDEHKAGQ